MLALELGGVARGERDTRDAIPDIAADARGEARPQPLRLEHELDLARVAARDAHPAPVAARLLGADGALVAHEHGPPALGELERGAGPGDAGADHDGIDARGERGHRPARGGASGGPGTRRDVGGGGAGRARQASFSSSAASSSGMSTMTSWPHGNVATLHAGSFPKRAAKWRNGLGSQPSARR